MEFLNILRFFFGHISFIPIELFLLFFLGGGGAVKDGLGVDQTLASALALQHMDHLLNPVG